MSWFKCLAQTESSISVNISLLPDYNPNQPDFLALQINMTASVRSSNPTIIAVTVTRKIVSSSVHRHSPILPAFRRRSDGVPKAVGTCNPLQQLRLCRPNRQIPANLRKNFSMALLTENFQGANPLNREQEQTGAAPVVQQCCIDRTISSMSFCSLLSFES